MVVSTFATMPLWVDVVASKNDMPPALNSIFVLLVTGSPTSWLASPLQPNVAPLQAIRSTSYVAK